LQVIITTLHADIEKKRYKGMNDVIKSIIKKQSFKKLYQGAHYRTIGNALALPALESVQKTFR
jgi:hypothetical protein